MDLENPDYRMSGKKNSGHKELELKGIGASAGKAIGIAYVLQGNERKVSSGPISEAEVDDHLELFHNSQKAIESELQNLQKDRFDKEVIDIINTQIVIVNDPELSKLVKKNIKTDLMPADKAIYEAFGVFLKLMADSGKSFGKKRSVDISDIRDRMIEVVQKDYSSSDVNDTHILVADELSPRQVIKAAGMKVKGLILKKGGRDSHAAIIARSVGMPIVVGIQNAEEYISGNDHIALNAVKGKVIVHPSKETLALYKDAHSEADIDSHILDAPNETADGYPFILRANVSFLEELEMVQKVGAEGVGLLRTESIYLDKDKFDDSKEQEKRYSKFLKKTSPHSVVIRLFDAGGDKQVGLDLKEENPCLGWRGIRLLLDQEEVLEDQLHAILRTASQYPGRVRLLLPMVTDLQEVIAIKKKIRTVGERLSEEGLSLDENLDLGIMVEVPAVALKADAFADHVDFFSIGTNDLSQYILAADRGNDRIATKYKQKHPAVWEMIKMVQQSAEEVGIEVSVCGEMASDPLAAACLLGLGINELSLAPGQILKVKALLTQKSREEMVSLAEDILLCSTTKEVNTVFEKWSN